MFILSHKNPEGKHVESIPSITNLLKLQGKFINGSDHGVVASYLELYEEGEVEHINGVWPVSYLNSFSQFVYPPGKENKIPQSKSHLSL